MRKIIYYSWSEQTAAQSYGWDVNLGATLRNRYLVHASCQGFVVTATGVQAAQVTASIRNGTVVAPLPMVAVPRITPPSSSAPNDSPLIFSSDQRFEGAVLLDSPTFYLQVDSINAYDGVAVAEAGVWVMLGIEIDDV